MECKQSGETTIDAVPCTSPWNKNTWSADAPALPCRLEDVMSEQLAGELQQEEEKKSFPSDDLSGVLDGPWETGEGTDNDTMIAQMLQLQFDREHDAMLAKEEQHLNKQSKALEDDDEDSSSAEEQEDKVEPELKFKKGFIGKGKNITTKHDATICGRRNANRAMDKFPPEFYTGDTCAMDMKLPNHVYNKLKSHSQAEAKRSARLHEKKEHSTADQAVDPRTRLAMYKLVNSGILEDINGIVSTGKESVVFHATGGSAEDKEIPSECVLKVFKTTLNEFKTREKYIRGDYRFVKDEFKKQNPRKIIKMWAEKEMINLNKMRRCGIPCPEVVMLKKHILVMSFIGHNQVPAVKLKHANLSTEQAVVAYFQTVEAMKKLYSQCKLVHADLSEYNILWHNGSVHLIDVSQSVDVSHPHAYEFLLRDCGNVSGFFSKLGVPEAVNQYQLFNDITGMNLKGEGEEFLAQIQEYENEEVYLSHGEMRKEYPFDYFFDRTAKDNTKKDTDKSEDNSSNTDEESSETRVKVHDET